MAINQINIKARLKAYPFVSPAVYDATAAAETETSELNQFMSKLERLSLLIPTDITQMLPGANPGASLSGTDEWDRIATPNLDMMYPIIKPLESTLESLDKIVSVLYKILKIIELFNSVFGSLSKLFVSIITMAQNKLNELKGSFGAGVYANVIVPPAFMLRCAGDSDAWNQALGGFDGFITRLQSSLDNTIDTHRPTFTVSDYVGGMVIIADSEDITAIWKSLKQLAAVFNFMQLFGISLSPPPPTNLRGFCGYFLDQAEMKKRKKDRDMTKKKFGVQIECDRNSTISEYEISRSRFPGGVKKIETYIPTTLVDNEQTGEQGLLSIIWDLIGALFSKKLKAGAVLPEREVKVYDDPDFNGGEPVRVSSISGSTVTYIDTDIKTKKKTVRGQEIELPYYINDSGEKIFVQNYYYIIRAVGGISGDKSKELVVTIKTCNDAFIIANVIEHSGGHYELLNRGFGPLNSWSSIELDLMCPWFVDVIDMLNGFLETFKGIFTDASDSFMSFLDQLKAKVQMFVDIIKVISILIENLRSFMFGPSIAFLGIPAAKGGMPVFVERVRSAKVPEGQTGFSGPNGVTIGIVLVYGASAPSMFPEMKAIEKTFDIIESLFTE